MADKQISISRRDWLKLSAAGVMSASSGWMLPRLALASEGQPQRAKACIMLHMAGGVSQHHSFTVPDVGAEVGRIATAVAGVHFSENFPRLAARMGDICLIRGMRTGNTDHGPARSLIHTGYNPNGTVVYPSVGNVASAELGIANSELPNFVAIHGGSDGVGVSALYRPVPAYLGPAHAPVPIQDPAVGLENLRAAVDARAFDDGVRLLEDFETGLGARQVSGAADSHRANVRRALQLMNSAKMRAFEIERESQATRDRYGDTKFGRALILARRLIEADVPFVEVSLTGWDDHSGALPNVARRARYVDPAISALFDDLKARGMFESTLVVFMTEFGRSPGSAGGHYARAWTTFLAGGGVRGGTVIGRVDARGGEVTDRPVTAQEFLATLCHGLNIDFTKEYMTREGRPMTFLPDSVEPVYEAFS